MLNINAQYKLHALRGIRKYLSLEKVKMLGNVFIDRQLNWGIVFENAEDSS